MPGETGSASAKRRGEDIHSSLRSIKPLNAYNKAYAFSFANAQAGSVVPDQGYLDHGDPSERCIPAYPHRHGGPAVAAFPDRAPGFRFQMPPTRAVDRPQSFFSWVVTVVGEHLRRQGISICQYLDDWLIYSRSAEEATLHTNLLVSIVAKLGFLVNLENPCLTPTRTPTCRGVECAYIQTTRRW